MGWSRLTQQQPMHGYWKQKAKSNIHDPIRKGCSTNVDSIPKQPCSIPWWILMNGGRSVVEILIMACKSAGGNSINELP